MHDIVFLFTVGFPYGNNEPFLYNEVESIKNETIMISSFLGDTQFVPMHMPENDNVRLIHPDTPFFNGSMVARGIATCQAFFSKYFWRELFSADIQPLNMRKVIQLLSCTSKAIRIVGYVSKLIDGNTVTINNKRCVFYSYWMNQLALAALMLSEKYGGIAISRCHGYDLYKRQENNYYVTYQRYLTEKLNYIFPISANGKNTLESLLRNASNISNKIKVSRLGTIDHGICEMKKNPDSFMILSCSNVTELKRVDLILRAIAHVKQFKIHWIHFGDGPELDRVKCLAGELNNSSDHLIELMGRRPNSEVIQYYKNHYVNLFINLSTSEGIPVSIMEAMSFGVPCLATDVGGVSEIVLDGLNGFLIDSSCTKESVASRIVDIKRIYDNHQEDSYRNAARESWVDRYCAENNYKTFYDEVRMLK